MSAQATQPRAPLLLKLATAGVLAFLYVPFLIIILYAFSTEDEVAPSQVLNNFAKTNPSLALAGGFSAEGLALSDADVKALAGLPSKNQLIAEVVAQLLSPVHDTTNALSGNLHALLDGIEAKAAA